MTKVMSFCIALLLAAAAAAHAGGIDLSVTACPGNPGAVGGDGGTIDCAGTAGVVVLGTFAPDEEIPDLVGLDVLLKMSVAPDLDAGGFWNMDPAGCGYQNGGTLAVFSARPPVGCGVPLYLPIWMANGSGGAMAAARTGGSTQSIAIVCWRASTASVASDQRLFGFQLAIDANYSIEAGGVCTGCTNPVCLEWVSARPGSAGALTPTPLTAGTGHYPGFGNTLSFNGGSGLCLAMPAPTPLKDGLESLYR